MIDGNALVRPPNTRYEALDNPVPACPCCAITAQAEHPIIPDSAGLLRSRVVTRAR